MAVVLSYYLFTRYEAHAFGVLGVPRCNAFPDPARRPTCGSGPDGFVYYLPAALIGGIPLGLVAVMDVVTGVRLRAVRFAGSLRQRRAVRLARVLSGTMMPAIVFGGFFSLFDLAFLNVKKDDTATIVATSVCAILVLAAVIMQLVLFVVTLMVRARRAAAAPGSQAPISGPWKIA